MRARSRERGVGHPPANAYGGLAEAFAGDLHDHEGAASAEVEWRLARIPVRVATLGVLVVSSLAMPDSSASIDDLLAHAGWLRELARRLVGEAGADDALQEVWLRVARRPPEGVVSPRGWLSSVLRSVAYRGRLRADAASLRERESAMNEALPSAAEVAARAEAQRGLVEAVLALEEPYRRTLLLHFFEGLPPSEIARRGNEPASTVRNRLARGIELLRRQFDERGEDRASWLPGLVLLAAPERAAAPTALLPLGSVVMLKSVSLIAASLIVLLVIWRPWSSADPTNAVGEALAPASTELAVVVDSASASLPAAERAATREPELSSARSPSGPAPGVARGRVVDPEGVPVPKAIVYAGTNTEVALALRSDAGEEFQQAITDEDGAFSLDLGAPGAHVLTARVTGFAPSMEFPLELDPDAGRDDLELVLRVGATVRGVVHGLDALPVAGRYVQIASPEGGEFLTTATDESGSFAFTSLCPGPWNLATYPGEGELSAVGAKTDFAAAMEFLVQVQRTLADGAEEVLVLGLPEPGGVRVTGELRRAGVPARGMLYWSPRHRPRERMLVQAGADGRFEIELPAPGEWIVLTRPWGIAGAGTLHTAEVPSSEAADLVLDVTGATLRGRVLGPDGMAREGVHVALVVLDGAPHRPLPLLGGEPGTTDVDGGYAFDLVPPGRYSVVAYGTAPVEGPPESGADEVDREGDVGGLAGGALGAIEVRGDDEFAAPDLVLDEGEAVDIRVLDAAGRPVRGAGLFIHDVDGVPLNPLTFLRTDEVGEARTLVLPRAPVTVTAIHRDGASRPVAVAPGQRAGAAVLELTLGPVHWIALDLAASDLTTARGSVEVTDAGGRRFAGLRDLARVHDAPPDHAHGERLLVGPLPTGVYEVRVETAGGAVLRASTALTETSPAVVLVAPR